MYRRILIVRLSHLGDVVHALPVYHALRTAYPDAELAWAVQSEFADLLNGLPGLARTFLFGRRSGLGSWIRLRNEFADWRPDWVIDAQGNTKSAMVALTSAAARRSSLARIDWRERFASHVSTDHAAPAEGPHAIDRMVALARHVAPDQRTRPVRFDPGLGAAELARGRALLEDHAASRRGDSAPDWIVHLSDPRDVRSWPTAHFDQLIRGLQAAGRRVLVLSGPAEAQVGEQLADDIQLPGVSHWVAQRGIRDLAATFAVGAEAGARLLACDSGPAHLAAASGMNVHLLAGPQDPVRTGPWPTHAGPELPRHTIVFNPTPPECAPCLARRCSHPAGPVCMHGLEPDHVANLLLSANAPPARPLPN